MFLLSTVIFKQGLENLKKTKQEDLKNNEET